ncbi:pilus assembly protein [Stenotrophomonas sp. ESTM1D_MKCIP4_1]|uniref:fimbrial biogenesis chaperone n=1 Tax=Stenotrophomonas sp. ESTM1D_MKCIP4_1 TaxID=2072414 RepID=UPI000D542B21|nr:fimbria/pilus periplasmic chaperone [Stenotrophomonas sp. ESTM1D_MKCIP4_1]AWH52860.1 pilus assembly protein [Stenotrophomonas sp. ESTM1D_MKCIP4_1]
MRWLPALLALLLALPAAALELSPTTLQLPTAGGRTELWLHNPGPTPWRGRLQVWSWDQQTGAERLQPSDQIITSPTVIDLPAGARQRVWLLPRTPAAVASEQAFRVLLTPDDRQQPRYSLPLFRGGDTGGAQPRLSVETGLSASQPILRLHNEGARHARLSDLAYEDAQGQTHLLLPGLAGYVLAARHRHWRLPARADGYRGGHFSARLQDGRVLTLPGREQPIAVSATSGL